MKQKFTLTINDLLIQRMKIRAVMDKRSVSDITEQLYAEYLKRSTSKQKPKQRGYQR